MKLFTAYFALEKFQIEMSSLMILLVAIRYKCFPAEAALERFLTGVRLDVVLQRSRMLENLEAVIIRALVLQRITRHRHACGLNLLIFGVVLVEHFHFSFPVLDGLLLNLVQVHGSILILGVLRLNLQFLQELLNFGGFDQITSRQGK